MKVSIQQAASNALAIWLASRITDVVVEPRWPNPDKVKNRRVITIAHAGKRRDIPLDPRLLSHSSQGDHQTKATWQVAACTQPLQLDVWAPTDVDRDDIIAQLDEALHVDQYSLATAVAPTPAGTGCLLAIADGWQDSGSTADFSFDGPELEDSSTSVSQRLYRAVYRGEVHVMLTVTSLTARQLEANLRLRISETDNPTDFP